MYINRLLIRADNRHNKARQACDREQSRCTSDGMPSHPPQLLDNVIKQNTIAVNHFKATILTNYFTKIKVLLKSFAGPAN